MTLSATALIVYALLSTLVAVTFFSRLIGMAALQKRFKDVKAEAADLPKLSLILPVRNEEANIETVVHSFMAQDYPARKLEFIVVNDNSTDRTPELLDTLARQYPALRRVDAPALPEGWSGKNHACHVGSKKATGQYLCFIDADVQARPHVLRRAVAYAMQEKADLLSLSPMQVVKSLGEKLLLSGIFLAIAGSIDPRAVNSAKRPNATANGQFMLFRREAYRRLGGHQAIKGTVIDDIELAKLVKTRGMKLAMSVADRDEFTARMYDGIPAIWQGFSKNLHHVIATRSLPELLTRSAYLLALGTVFFASPLVLALSMSSGAGELTLWHLPVALGTVMLWSMLAVFARQIGVGVGYALVIPFSILGTVPLLWTSYRKARTGAQVQWKGRAYQAAAHPARTTLPAPLPPVRQAS